MVRAALLPERDEDEDEDEDEVDGAMSLSNATGIERGAGLTRRL